MIFLLYRPVTRYVRMIVTAAAVMLGTVVVTAQSQVTYIYDSLGRLTGVVSPSGEAAVYEYDAVGNLLSITRTPANTVSVIDFAPKTGAVGSTVRVYGTAFSSTPAQNSVTFDGVSATVDSATATELVMTVPAGATTGPIAVTSPNGSASSAVPFVIGTPGAPQILQFSPVIGTPGTTISIDGSNFEAVAATNVVSHNVTRTVLTAVSTTSLTTTVPVSTASGRISVATPHGTAVSSDDFFVPPPPYGVNDVIKTGRIPFATAHVATIGTAGKIGLLLFDGAAGQRVSLKVGPGMGSVAAILNPTAVAVGTVTFGGAVTAFLDTRILTRTGTHTIVVDPTGASTGNLTLTLYDVPPDVTGSLAFGTGFPVTLSTPGQNARLSFAGTASQRVSPITLGETLSTARAWHSATVLSDGRVLLLGGVDRTGTIVGSAEIYDPEARVFTANGTDLTPRAAHTATLLGDGRVVIAGGRGPDGHLTSVFELWDPATGVVTEVPTRALPRIGHRATLLSDGAVLIQGGVDEHGQRLASELLFPEQPTIVSAVGFAEDEGDPVFAGSDPLDGALDVALAPTLVVRFSGPVPLAHGAAGAFSLSAGSAAVPIDIVAAESGRIFFVRPRRELDPGTPHTLTVGPFATGTPAPVLGATVRLPSLRAIATRTYPIRTTAIFGHQPRTTGVCGKRGVRPRRGKPCHRCRHPQG